MLKGKIHSVESMGLVDGPGIRVVVFFQGCALRCLYCHNPDTWNEKGGIEYTAEELVKKIKRFKSYFTTSGGGVTFSGGDPLRQPEFLLEALKLCKAEGIHTCLD
ncbi:4Fe-4S cluster-binding domain-containing protein, partial [Clostridium perfringens]|nr:4Fe-4S cluster-binding domain-containing protein [Clostridium perfringens]